MGQPDRQRTASVYGPNYRAAREQVLNRTRRICGFCGSDAATQSHHWAGTDLAGPYPTDAEITEADLTPLCDSCHLEATTRRRMIRMGIHMLEYDNALSNWRQEWLSGRTGAASSARPPLIQHGTAGMDPDNPGAQELTKLAKKRGSNRTDADQARMRELEAVLSVWERGGQVTIIAPAIRGTIEGAARTLKQGAQVRRGLRVGFAVDFEHNVAGADFREVAVNAKWTTDVKVGQSRIMRTRAKFDDWAAEFTVSVDDEQVDKSQLASWLDIAGRQIGIGDWRPDKSGFFGTFDVASIEEVE